MSFCVMFAMFSPFVFFFKLNLLSGRLAHISNCINGALSEKSVRFVQNPRTKSARRRNNCKLELLAWTTFNHKGLRKCSNDCLGVETSINATSCRGKSDTDHVNSTPTPLRLWLRQEEAIKNLSEVCQN